MVLMSCSGTGGGIYAKLANGSGLIQLRSGLPHSQFIGVAISCASLVSPRPGLRSAFWAATPPSV